MICECYPGGASTKEIRSGRLKTLCHQPYFSKLIITQAFMLKLIREHNVCPESKIHYLYGAPMYVQPLPHRYYGRDKPTLDICFTAVGNTYRKGYDLFLELVKKLHPVLPLIRFHMIGLDRTRKIGKHPIIFHGLVTDKKKIAALYSTMDLLISPVRLVKGDEHDAFPVGCCIEAALHGVGILATDEFGDNTGERVFARSELVVIKPLINDLVSRVMGYYASPSSLLELCLAGQRKFSELYSYDNQLAPREEILFSSLNQKSMSHLDQRLARLQSLIPSDFGGGSSFEKVQELMQLAVRGKMQRVVEIGVYRGKTLAGLAVAMQETGGLAVGIDPYSKVEADEKDLRNEPGLQTMFRRQGGIGVMLDRWLNTTDFNQIYQDVLGLLAANGLDGVCRLIRQPAVNAIEEVRQLMESIDLIHIDGNHDTLLVTEDITLYVPLVKKGGYVAMDDTNFLSVQRALPLLEERGCEKLRDYGTWQLWRKG